MINQMWSKSSIPINCSNRFKLKSQQDGFLPNCFNKFSTSWFDLIQLFLDWCLGSVAQLVEPFENFVFYEVMMIRFGNLIHIEQSKKKNFSWLFLCIWRTMPSVGFESPGFGAKCQRYHSHLPMLVNFNWPPLLDNNLA